MDQKRFERDITACQCEIHRWEQRYKRISAIRLLLFIVSLGACILLWRIEPLLSVPVSYTHLDNVKAANTLKESNVDVLSAIEVQQRLKKV